MSDPANVVQNLGQPGSSPPGTFPTWNRGYDPQNNLPAVSDQPGNAGPYAASNRRAYDPNFLSHITQGEDSQSNLMGPSSSQSPEDQALSARASQFYQTSLNDMARKAVPKSIAMQTKLQTNDINNRSAIYSDMQTRSQINFHEAMIQREQALGVAIMQRDLYSSLFGGLSKIGGSVAAAAIGTPSGSQGYYASQMSAPQLDSGYSTTSGAPNLGVDGVDPPPSSGPGLGMDYNFADGG